MNDAIATAVDAATDAAHRQVTDAELAYSARYDHACAAIRFEIAQATGARLALLMVEQLPADVYVRHLDRLIQDARDLAHTAIRGQPHAANRVAAAWDVIEDDIVAALVAKEMRK